MPTLTRLTARSVVLSVLLGAHPAWASAAELIRLTADFDIKESALRVALTRMVAAGDLGRPVALLPGDHPAKAAFAALADHVAAACRGSLEAAAYPRP